MLSTGMSKKPWIWSACRSIVSTRSTPTVSQQVGHDLGRDRHARRARPAVLAGIAEVGDHGGDAAGRGALERIDHDQQFHQVVVGRRAGGLHHEDVLAAHVLLDLDRRLRRRRNGRPSPCRARCRGGWRSPAPAPGFALPVNTTGVEQHGYLSGCGRCRATSARDLAGEEGLEPSHAGIKIRCLNQLGDSPTQVRSSRCAPRNRRSLARRCPAGQRMDAPGCGTSWPTQPAGQLRRHRCRRRSPLPARANTALPEPVIRLLPKRACEPSRSAAHLGAKRLGRRPAGRCDPAPDRPTRPRGPSAAKARDYSSVDVVRPAGALEDRPRLEPAAGLTTANQRRRQRSTGVSRSPMPSTERVAPPRKNGTSAPSARPIVSSRSRGQSRPQRRFSASRVDGRVGAAAAHAGARRARACRSRCRRRAALPLRRLQRARGAQAEVVCRAAARRGRGARAGRRRARSKCSVSHQSISMNTDCSRW